MPLGGAEDVHFSCFHSSRQLGFRIPTGVIICLSNSIRIPMQFTFLTKAVWFVY
jgi:hypothetical protein